MTNSMRARLAGVALGALVMACSAHAARRFPTMRRFTWRRRRRISKSSASERRSRSEKMGGARRNPRIILSWWYFDGLLDDGTVVVVWFGDNWLYGSAKESREYRLTPPGKPTRRVMRTFDDPGAFASDQANVRIGPHSFKGDRKPTPFTSTPPKPVAVRAAIDSAPEGRLLPPRNWLYQRPGDRFFAWLVAVPEGAVTGTLTADGVSRQVSGSGYHDHNWVSVSPADLFDNWWWGRGRSGDQTIIASDIHGKAAGGTVSPLLRR